MGSGENSLTDDLPFTREGYELKATWKQSGPLFTYYEVMFISALIDKISTTRD